MQPIFLVGWVIENLNFAGETSKYKRCIYFPNQAQAASTATAAHGTLVFMRDDEVIIKRG